MKIQINATGQIVDEPLNRAQRMINKGIAHLPERVKDEVKLTPPVIEIKEEEPIIFTIQNGVVKDGFIADDILPEITEENVDELKTSKPIKKGKKKVKDIKKNENNP